KAGYRLLTKSQGGEAPIVMNSEITISKNEQVRNYVFCKDCEDRFNKNGEGWILKNCFRDGEGFALKDALGAAEPEYNDANLFKVYASAKLTGIDVSKIVYFAASVFWKSSVHRWQSGKHKLTSPTLGRKYEEQFRQFLLGNEGFPEKATLWLSLITDDQLWNYFTFPYGRKENGYWRKEFQFFGFVFTLFIGNLVPSDIRRFCLAHSTEHYISMSKAADDMVLTHMGKLLAKSKPVGSLRKEFIVSKNY
ncbi:MAG TPA: hypothetical protein VGO69_02985, partial [Pyrinomonadaceae bacterium]|nr:hypothetical protein [Pyrinomonadaceae bacterium]